MICLLAAQSASLHGLGPVGALGIISALLAQTTFLPALLLVLGRAAFWPRIPRAGDPGREESRLWAGVGPPGCPPPGPGRDRGRAAARRGLRRARVPAHRQRPPGRREGPSGQRRRRVPARRPLPGPASRPARPARPGLPGPCRRRHGPVHARHQPAVLPAAPVGNYDAYSVVLSVATLRADRDSHGRGAAPAARPRRARCPGRRRPRRPVRHRPGRQPRRPVLIPLVLLVILVMIALLLQAIVAPLVLVATTALSFGASFGLSSPAVAIRARLSAASSPRSRCTSSCSWSPSASTTTSSSRPYPGRVRRTRHPGGHPARAQRHRRRHHRRGRGARRHVPALTLLPSVTRTEVGTAIAIGVLLDTLLVRTVLVPAALITVGDRIWWPGPRPADTKPARHGLATGTPANISAPPPKEDRRRG